MVAKVSVAGAVRQAKQEEAARARSVQKAFKDASTKAMAARSGGDAPKLSTTTMDSFINFAHKLGVGADNALSSGSYGYNPITRVRTLLEWIHRGSWLGGQAIDIVADDMTREGVDFITEMEPADVETIEAEADTLGIWEALNEGIKWSRLYGGSIVVMLIDGQDFKTPLKLETVGKDQFKGLLTLDRWMLQPSLNDLVTDYGPHLGLPKYYQVQANAPALRGVTIHHSRIAYRGEGVKLPYQQRLTENMWGISVLERIYDRMIAFDSASTGAAQLVFKSHLRTLKIDGLRDIVAAGGAPMTGLYAYTEVMRRFQGIEGLSLIDKNDEFEVQSSSSGMTGISTIIDALADQLAGALQVPKTRLFGQSPGGLGSNGKGEERQYHDGIKQKQSAELGPGVLTTYKLMAQSKGVKLPKNFGLQFASLVELDDAAKGDLVQKTTTAILGAYDGGVLSQKVTMQELRQQSKTTGVFSNITAEDIDAADDTLQPPVSELDMQTSLAQVKAGLEPPGGPGAAKPGQSKPGAAKLPSDPSKSKAPGSGKTDGGGTKRTPLKD